MPEEHALLSASGAHRWLNCTPSARLEEQFPDSTSEYAEEGTLAHSLAELKLKKYLTGMKPSVFKKELKVIQDNALYTAEMNACTDDYLEFVKDVLAEYPKKPYVAIEQRLDFSHVAPEGFGTGDCVVIGGDTITIIDFKFGRGVPISAQDNPQMKLYALGALAVFSLLYEIKHVKMIIFQPRLNNISAAENTANELFKWAEEIKPLAHKAFNGEGEYCAGDWCRFCRAKNLCRARATFSQVDYDGFSGKLPPLITDNDVGEILKKADDIKKWVADLEDYALKALLDGKEIPGWKAVEGRSNRQFEDTDKAFAQVVKSGYDEAVLYERKPITLTAVEKLLGKKKFEDILASYVIKPAGKPTLAPESDKREAIKTKMTAAEMFAAETEN